MVTDLTRLAPAKSRPSGALRRSRKVYPDRAHGPVLAEILALGEAQESGHPAAAGCNHFIRF